MAAYPNLRQRDHVENVFSIGSNPIAATAPGYPNQQRTPAQTRCVAGANPVPGTNVTSRTCSVTTLNGEVAGSNPAGRKPVAQWESANAERGNHVRDASGEAAGTEHCFAYSASRVRLPPSPRSSTKPSLATREPPADGYLTRSEWAGDMPSKRRHMYGFESRCVNRLRCPC